jgi:alpha-L-rhamnosidase
VGGKGLAVKRLRWDGLDNPLGVYTFHPHLSWAVSGTGRSRRQTAYQVLVATAVAKLHPGQADLWDSGRVVSSESVNVDYGGPPPRQRQKGFWTVRVWDEAERVSSWSQPAWWEMTPVEEEVEGEMIGDGAGAPRTGHPPGEVIYLRKELIAPARLRQARLFASAEGAYEVHLNGHRVGARELAPGWIGYRRWRRTSFQTYDVTALIHAGQNAIGAIAAGAWCTVALGPAGAECGADPPSVMIVLELTSQTGDITTLRSDETWRSHPGPIRSSHLFDGESYDARMEMPGWDRPGFDDRSWIPAKRYDRHELNPFHDLSPPIVVGASLPAAKLSRPRPGAYVFDLGQNIVGWARLRLTGPRGTEIVLRFAEALNPDGSLSTTNLGTARATDRYVMAGIGEEIWEPRFTVHGFRYVELTGATTAPSLRAITGQVVHSKMTQTGWLETSSPLLNRLYANIVWSQRGAFLGVPTRGPARDERVGSLLDGQLFASTACLNMDVAGVFRKWIDDIRDGQRNGDAFGAFAPRVDDMEGGPGAGDGGVIIPWTSVVYYADRQVTDAFAPAMARWIDLIHHENPNLLWTRRRGVDFGNGSPTIEDTDKSLVATAFFAHDADLLARTFRFMGPRYGEYAAKYETLFADVRRAFTAAFVQPDGRLSSDTQTAYALAIRFGLLAGRDLERAGTWLIARVARDGAHVTAGPIGAAHLLPALSAVGRDDLAYRVLMQETCPAWLCSVKNGATTLWERFDGWTPEHGLAAGGQSSLNHVAWGAVGEWLYAAVGGIELDPAAPAGKHVFVRPRPGGGLTHARSRYDSLYGSLRTDWTMRNGTFTLDLEIPANTTATVALPAGGSVTEGGQPLRADAGLQDIRSGPAGTTLLAQSGRYRFSVSPQASWKPGS